MKENKFRVRIKPMWAWIKKRIAMWREKAIITESNVEPTPRVAVFSTPDSFSDEVIDDCVYKGLQYTQTLSGGGGRDGCIITVWRNTDAYDVNKRRFLNDIKLTSHKVLFEGFSLGIRKGKKNFWKRLLFSKILPWFITFIVTITAVLGNIEKIWELGGWLFGPPMIETPIQPPTNVLVGERFKFQVTVRNIRQIGNCFIKFDGLSTNHPNDLELMPLAIQSVPGVKPNGEAVLPVSGTAHGEGTHKVIVKVQSKAGLIWRTKKETYPESEVCVWPSLAIGSRRIKDIKPSGKLCEVEFELRPGDSFPRGIEVEAKLERVQKVRFVAVQFPRTSQWDPYENWNNIGNEVAILKWRTKNIAPMRKVTFTIMLGSEEKSKRDEWEVIVQSIKFAFTRDL